MAGFDDITHIDPEMIDGSVLEWEFTAKLYKHPEFGYIVLSEIPGENGEAIVQVGILPEAIQNMIPVYKPMILQAISNNGE